MKKKNCSCEKCKECCWRCPGWFGSIKEIQGAAKLMKMTTKEFCKKYLIIEWWAGDKNIYVPAPRRDFSRTKNKLIRSNFILNEVCKKNGEGFIEATWGHNLVTGVACIFLTDKEKCSIHKSKPFECADSFGCDDNVKKSSRIKVLEYWKKHQDWIFKINEK